MNYSYMPAAFLRAANIIKKDKNLKKKLLQRLEPFKRETPVSPSADVKPNKTMYGSSAIIVFVLIFGLPWLAVRYYTDIQQAIYGDEGMVFYTGGLFLYIALSFFLGCLIAITLSYLIYYVSPKTRITYFTHNLIDDLKFIHLETRPFDEVLREYDVQRYAAANLKKVAVLTVVVFLLFTPLYWLSIKPRIVANEDNMVVHHMFAEKSTYSWDEAVMYTLQMNPNAEHLEPQFLIEFESGEEVNIWNFGIIDTPPEVLIHIAQTLDEHGAMGWKDPLPDMSHLRESIRENIRKVYGAVEG